MSPTNSRSAQRSPPTLPSLHNYSTAIHPHDLPPSSRSPSPSKQGAIFESQRTPYLPTARSPPLRTSMPAPAESESKSNPASPTSSIPRRPRYGAEQRMRNLSVSGDDWVQGLDRVDSPGPPSFGNKAGRHMATAKGHGGYPQPGEQGELGEESGNVKMPVITRRATVEGKPMVSEAPSVSSLSGQVQMKSRRERQNPHGDYTQGTGQNPPLQGVEAVDSRSPPRLSQMPPPPIPSPPTSTDSRKTPAVHVIHPSTSTTASFAPESLDKINSSVNQDQALERPVSVRSTGSQRAFADVVQMMQEGRASRETVSAGAKAGVLGASGSGIGEGAKEGSMGRPPKKRQNVMRPGGVLAAMTSKSSFAKLREMATVSKASLTGSVKKEDRDTPQTTGVPAASAATTSADMPPAKSASAHEPHTPHTNISAAAQQQQHAPKEGVERRTTILRPAPLPPLRASSPSATRFAPATVSPRRSLTNRGSGLLTNTTLPAARSSGDALFAPPAGSMQDQLIKDSAAPTPAPSDHASGGGLAAGGGWLHNPNVDFGSAPNLPLSMRLSQVGLHGQRGDGNAQQYQTPQGQAGQGGLKRSISVREDGTVEIPRFKRKELNLGMVPQGMGRRALWLGLWSWCILWTLAGLFFDVNVLYMLVQCATTANTGSTAGNNSGWTFALAAYGTCMFISIVVVWLGWGVWYESWRKWRLPQPPIEPIHTSLPASLYVSLPSFPHFCFFLHTRLSMLGTKYTTDILPETASLGLQTIPSLLPVLPRASIAVIVYVTYYARSAGIPLRGGKDEAFWASSGRLTDYARGVVLGFMLLSAARLAVALVSGAVIFAFSRSRYDGPTAGPVKGGKRIKSWRHRNRPSLIPLSRTKYEGHGTAGTARTPYEAKVDNESSDPSTPQRKKPLKRDPSQTLSPSKGWTAESDSTWGWRERGRNRLQDAYELCMMRPSRRRSERMMRSIYGNGNGSFISYVGRPTGHGDGGVGVASDGSPRRDGEDVEKLASPADSALEQDEGGGLLSPTLNMQRKDLPHGAEGGSGEQATSPMRTSSPGKGSNTPTIRFADREALSSASPAPRSAPTTSQTQSNKLVSSPRPDHASQQTAVNGHNAEAASSTATLRPEYDPARPDSGVLPQGRFSPLALDPRLSPALPTGGIVLGAPIKGSMSDPQMGKQDARSAAGGKADGAARADRPNTADKSTSTTKITHAHVPPKRPLLVARDTQSHTSLTSRESLSSHEMYYTPMGGTPMPSHEELMGRQEKDGGETQRSAGMGCGEGRDETGVVTGDGEETLEETKSGSATPTPVPTASNSTGLSQSTLMSAHLAHTSADRTHHPRPSTSSSTSSHESESDSTALLSYDDFGYPSYPTTSSRSRRKSPTKRHYEKERHAGGGTRDRSRTSPSKIQQVKQVISSPSLKNLRDRAGSMVGRRTE